MSAPDEIRNASKQFYAALNRMIEGEAGAMTPVWSHGTSVTAMHPIGGRQVGWNEVQASFDQVAGIATDGKVELTDQLIHVAGDLAYEVGVESGHATMAGQRVTIEHRVTNIYQREAGTWKVIHHHTDVSPAMLEVLHRLQSRT